MVYLPEIFFKLPSFLACIKGKMDSICSNGFIIVILSVFIFSIAIINFGFVKFLFCIFIFHTKIPKKPNIIYILFELNRITKLHIRLFKFTSLEGLAMCILSSKPFLIKITIVKIKKYINPFISYN